MQVETICELNKQLMLLQSAFMQTPFPSLEERVRHLTLIKERLVAKEAQFVIAASSDFGSRTEFDSVVGDIVPTVNALGYMIKHLKQWMKPQKRHPGLMMWPSSVKVQYSPKGVVGVISPWNFPIQLAIVPVVTALAAGNRVMLKLSEYTPYVNAQMKELFAGLESHCVIVEGDHHVASAFSSLKFDHLFFTGATEVGKKVMASAAQNLVPVTLELGGKSPVIVANDADVEHAARTILFGKLLNAGQICVAPDYVLVTKENAQELVTAIQKHYTAQYPNREQNHKLSSIINERQSNRLWGLLEDAEKKGATIWPNKMQTDINTRMGLHIVTDVNSNMAILQDEIFGPILPIVVVEDLKSAMNYVELRERPLATYLFTQSKEVADSVAKNVRTGSLAVNEVVLQVVVEDIPFGGVGYSGIGEYHGKEGFITMSHKKSVTYSGKIALIRSKLLIRQPKWLLKLVKKMTLR